MTKEVLALVFEFVLSIVVLVGSGFLLYQGKATETAVSAITAVITFWFARRMYDSATKSNQDNSNQTQAPSQAPLAPPTTPPELTGHADPINLNQQNQPPSA